MNENEKKEFERLKEVEKKERERVRKINDLIAQNKDRVSVALPKGLKDKILKYDTVNKFIIQAVQEKLERLENEN